MAGLPVRLGDGWWGVGMVYHATNEDTLEAAEQSETLKVSSSHLKCSLFSCNLWQGHDGAISESTIHDGRPTKSPYGSKRVVIPVADVLGSPDDFLVPIHNNAEPGMILDQEFRRNTYIDMVYIQHRDIVAANPELNYLDVIYLQKWQLKNHPFVRLIDNSRLGYYYRYRVWWKILIPYRVSISDNYNWESGIERQGDVLPGSLTVDNPVTLKLLTNPSIFKALNGH